jgi:hypothetical protein
MSCGDDERGRAPMPGDGDAPVARYRAMAKTVLSFYRGDGDHGSPNRLRAARRSDR